MLNQKNYLKILIFLVFKTNIRLFLLKIPLYFINLHVNLLTYIFLLKSVKGKTNTKKKEYNEFTVW